MNLDEINVFGGNLGGNETPNEFESENNDFDLDDIECPVVPMLLGSMFEPRPYGTVLTREGQEELLRRIGYKVIEKGDTRYALKDGEKLGRGKNKEPQEVENVYRKVTEELAIAKFVKDWNDVHSTRTDTTKA